MHFTDTEFKILFGSIFVIVFTSAVGFLLWLGEYVEKKLRDHYPNNDWKNDPKNKE